MDGTGDLLAVGAPGTDLGAFAKNGSVTIYRYNKQNGSWEKQNFTSNAGKFMDPNYNNFGDKVSLSGNGTTLISSYGWFEPTKSYNYVYNLVNYAPIAANYAPIAVADQITVAEGGTITTLLGGGTSLLANDTDAENNPLTAIVVTNPINGILTLNSNGTFNYVHNGSETISDSFTYKANDGNSNSNIVTVTITINPVNDAPIAVADQITVAEGGTTTTLVGGINNVLTNDTDSENNALTAKLVSGVTNGILTLNSNGTFSYVHNGSETTSDSFTYKANDGALDSNTVTVIITITPVNDAPIAVADQVLVLKGGTSTTLVGGATSVLTNDTDAENNKLTASLVSGVTSGTLTLNADGTFSYVHNDSGTTFDSFTYKANDGTLNSNVVTVTITIIPSFTLPSTNFSIQVKDETCITKSNGEINITAVESYGYVATVNGKSYNFVNNSLTVSNQPPGTYSICISIPGKIFEQCFTAIVSKGKTITGKLRAATNKVSVEIVEGTAPFQIFVNGKEQFETELTTFSVVVKKGDLLEVKTAKSCEGIYSKGIGDLLGAITLYPNPTSGSFEINLPTSRKEVVIDLYTAASQLISKRTYPIENERVQLNLGNEPSGVYIVKIYLDTPENLTIIKN
jgi:VCBS repeat-containing protein